ncbi:hypothetical protein [Bifidobacterium rousetti]|uniref:hypothetical protein n=1 Tax=Bifidobacterium rousetti TaxID=2045439 RepID=UPI00168AE597|nr:hypothetical protein [Bifidobacterium rousetti]
MMASLEDELEDVAEGREHAGPDEETMELSKTVPATRTGGTTPAGAPVQQTGATQPVGRPTQPVALYPYRVYGTVKPILSLLTVVEALIAVSMLLLFPGSWRQGVLFLVFAAGLLALRVVLTPLLEAGLALDAAAIRWGLTVMTVGPFDPSAPSGRQVTFVDRQSHAVRARLVFRRGYAWLTDASGELLPVRW